MDRKQRPISAFELFIDDHPLELNDESRFKIAGDWRQLPDEERAFYIKQAERIKKANEYGENLAKAHEEGIREGEAHRKSVLQKKRDYFHQSKKRNESEVLSFRFFLSISSDFF